MRFEILLAFFSVTLLFFTACGQQAEERASEEAVTREPETTAPVKQAIGAVTPGLPFIPAIKVGNTLYVSGQVALDPATGEEVRSSVEEETEQVMKNIETLVHEAGFEMSDIVRATVYLIDINDYAAMNSVYGRYFPETPPARACVAVKELVFGFKVEISCIAQR